MEDHLHKVQVSQSKSWPCIWFTSARNFGGLLPLKKISSTDSY